MYTVALKNKVFERGNDFHCEFSKAKFHRMFRFLLFVVDIELKTPISDNPRELCSAVEVPSVLPRGMLFFMENGHLQSQRPY